jgi:hypothetical protein
LVSWETISFYAVPQLNKEEIIFTFGRGKLWEGEARYAYTALNGCFMCRKEARGSVAGWGIMLAARRLWVWFSMRSLDFSFDLILPAALWPWGRLSL